MTPREQIEALAAEMESGWGAAQTSLASFALDTASRLRAVLASWTPTDEKPVSHGRLGAERQSPTKGADAGCDESVRGTRAMIDGAHRALLHLDARMAAARLGGPLGTCGYAEEQPHPRTDLCANWRASQGGERP
jgi:hypothetical protein